MPRQGNINTKINIFIVEKRRTFLDGLRNILNEPGLTIIGDAIDGNEALEKISTLLPDIVITNINIPGLDGLELTRRIKTKRPETHVFIVTLLDKCVRKAQEVGADGYFLMDISEAGLIPAIRSVMDDKNPDKAMICDKRLTPGEL